MRRLMTRLGIMRDQSGWLVRPGYATNTTTSTLEPRRVMSKATRSISCIALALTASFLGVAPAVQAQAPGQDATQAPAPGDKPAQKRPRRTDRIFARDLEGIWVSAAYLDALRATRAPLEASKKVAPLVIKVQKEGYGYPLVRTDFDRAVLLRVIDIQPEEKPGAFRVVLAADDMNPVSASETTNISFRGQKNEQGRFERLAVADPTFGKRKFQDVIRLEEGLAPTVNGIVIAGSYADDKGGQYSFSRNGEAEVPGGRFRYDVRLSPKGANCSIIEEAQDEAAVPRPRFGFRWKGQALELYEVDAKKPDNLRCGAKPVAVLTPKAGEGEK
jgi:hypothetical protein